MRRTGLLLCTALSISSCASDPLPPDSVESGNSVRGESAEEPLPPDLQLIADHQTDDYQIAYHMAWAGHDREAAEIMMPLAQQGDPRAEFWIGSQYLGGRVFEHSDAEAVRWIRRSAEHGYALAQFNLGIMYRDGRRGLEQDFDEARKWFGLAAAQGDSSAKSALVALEQATAD